MLVTDTSQIEPRDWLGGHFRNDPFCAHDLDVARNLNSTEHLLVTDDRVLVQVVTCFLVDVVSFGKPTMTSSPLMQRQRRRDCRDAAPHPSPA